MTKLKKQRKPTRVGINVATKKILSGMIGFKVKPTTEAEEQRDQAEREEAKKAAHSRTLFFVLLGVGIVYLVFSYLI